MAKQKKPTEAAEQLHNQDEVDFERIKELMGPPPLEAPSEQSSELGNDNDSEQDSSKPVRYTPTAPELDPNLIKEQLAENLSVKSDKDEKVAVISENIDTQVVEEQPVRRPTRIEAPKTGLVSSEDYDDPEITPDITDDLELDKAVDDIVAKESDSLLAAEDEKVVEEQQAQKKSLGKRFAEKWSGWWHRPKNLVYVFLVLLLFALVLFAIPTTRYKMLNLAGVRVRASLRVIDQSTLQPLKNTEVLLAGATAKTTTDGLALFENLPLGKTELVVKKRAFAEERRQVVLGWGSNPLDEMKMRVTGTIYRLKLADYFSSKPIEGVEAGSGEFSALSSETGEVSLAIEKVSETDPEITIDHPGYRVEKFTPLGNEEQREVKMVPRSPHVFVSKRSGRFDLYKIDADGKNEQVILEGTGREREDMVLLSNVSAQKVAYVSTRDGQRNKDGFLLSSLYIVDIASGELERLVLSERVQVLGWSSNKLVYVATADGVSGNDPNRQKAFSYNLETAEKKELVSTNYLNDILLANDNLYYAPSNAYQSTEVGLFRIKIDGSSKERLYDQEIWSIFRSAYEKLTISTQQDWFDVQLVDPKLTKLGGAPADLRSRKYSNSTNGQDALWIDERDGKGVVLKYSSQAKQDEVVTERSGIRYPVYWLGFRVIVFRVVDGREVADYVMSLDGGTASKIRDVTNTGTVDHDGY